MPENLKRHAIYLDDQELMLLDRAVRVYAQVIAIQVPIRQPQREAIDAAHTSAVIQYHRNCQCPIPPGPVAAEAAS